MPYIIDVYSGGLYLEIMSLRLHEFFAFRNINLIYYAPKVLALFIAGSLFYKHDFLSKINSSVRKSFVWFLVLIITGVSLNIFTDSIVEGLSGSGENPFATAIYMLVFELANIFLGFSYILLVLILTQLQHFDTILQPLKYVGRTALSNYLIQSVIFTTLMYSYGFAKFGSFQPWQLVIMAVVVFVLQLVISRAYLQRFRFGPMEWLWRKLTYGKSI